MVAEWVYIAICCGLVVFQLALTFGAPWGHLTQGGFSEGTLPPTKRALAALSALILVAMATTVWGTASGQITARWPLWIVLAVTALTTVANLATPSSAERRLWGPVTVVMLAALLWIMFVK